MKFLITGGAGFIGCNAAARYLGRGDEVVVLDNLSRRGADKNLAWLQGLAYSQGADARLSHVQADIRSAGEVLEAFQAHRDTDVVVHLAGQVAVTTSVADPRNDFEVNALGSFNVLEASRRLHQEGQLRALLYTSTNKVYGGMEDVGVVAVNGRYGYGGEKYAHGVPETQPLDFHSPYGCSKGSADQYTIDYARIYGLPTVCLRQSAIYGPRQMGVEDQGWVSWFCIQAVLGRPITIYGDGMQVRDVLHVRDLIDAYDAAIERIEAVKGQVFNLGGGPKNVLAIGEVPRMLEQRLGAKLDIRYDEWRPGDQRVFIADIRKAERDLDWTPKIGPERGMDELLGWVRDNEALFKES